MNLMIPKPYKSISRKQKLKQSADALSISRKTQDCPGHRVKIKEVARGEDISSYMNILWVLAEELRRKQIFEPWKPNNQ